MAGLTRISLLLVIILVAVSAYLRLHGSGIGCPDWPACYGQIGTPPEPTLGVADSAYQRIVAQTNAPLAWAAPLHRLVASVLGLLVLGLFLVSLRRRSHRLSSAALLALTVYLATLGIRSGSLHDPAVVMGNLAGGFAMLGLLGWLVFSMGPRGTSSPRVAAATATAIAVLSLQILFGGLTSANFAALACTDLPQCQGGWWPGPALAPALDLSREHAISLGGRVIGGPEQVAIQRAHRLGAIATALLVTIAAGAAFRAGARLRVVAGITLVLVAAELTVGGAAVIGDIPMVLAWSHNLLAALLLLALLKLQALSTKPPADVRM